MKRVSAAIYIRLHFCTQRHKRVCCYQDLPAFVRSTIPKRIPAHSCHCYRLTAAFLPEHCKKPHASYGFWHPLCLNVHLQLICNQPGWLCRARAASTLVRRPSRAVSRYAYATYQHARMLVHRSTLQKHLRASNSLRVGSVWDSMCCLCISSSTKPGATVLSNVWGIYRRGQQWQQWR